MSVLRRCKDQCDWLLLAAAHRLLPPYFIKWIEVEGLVRTCHVGPPLPRQKTFSLSCSVIEMQAISFVDPNTQKVVQNITEFNGTALVGPDGTLITFRFAPLVANVNSILLIPLLRPISHRLLNAYNLRRMYTKQASTFNVIFYYIYALRLIKSCACNLVQRMLPWALKSGHGQI